MRILVVHAQYTSLGGENISVAAEIAGLRKMKGIEVVTHFFNNADLEGAGGLRAMNMAFAPPRRQVEDLAAKIRAFRPDILHTHNLFPSWARVVSLAAMRGGPFKLLRTVRNYRSTCLPATHFRDGQSCQSCVARRSLVPGVLHGCYRGSLTQSMAAAGMARRAEKVLPSGMFDGHIAISNHMAQYISRVVPHASVHVKYNPVAGPPTASSGGVCSPNHAIRSIDGLFVGRPTPEKGFDDFADVARRNPTRSFVCVGTEVPDEGRFPDNIRFRGVLSHHETLECMERSRYVLVPSRWQEPFGRVAAEAASRGAIPLVSRSGGLPEVADRISQEHVFSQAAFAAGVSRVIRQTGDNEWQRLSSLARRTWAENFSEVATSKALVNLYGGILS